MAIELLPIPLPTSADASMFKQVGREVKGVDPGNMSPEQMKEIEEALYKAYLSICRTSLVTDGRVVIARHPALPGLPDDT
jgi:xanthine dioxygenase